MKDVMKKLPLAKVVTHLKKNNDGVVIDTDIETVERNYLLIMDINVLEQIDNKYKTDDKDGLTIWGNMASEPATRYKALAEFLCFCVNEGIRIENKTRKQNNLQLLETFKEDEITLDLSTMMDTVTSLIHDSTKSKKSEDVEKN